MTEQINEPIKDEKPPKAILIVSGVDPQLRLVSCLKGEGAELAATEMQAVELMPADLTFRIREVCEKYGYRLVVVDNPKQFWGVYNTRNLAQDFQQVIKSRIPDPVLDAAVEELARPTKRQSGPRPIINHGTGKSDRIRAKRRR